MDGKPFLSRRTILAGVAATVVASPLKAQGSAAGEDRFAARRCLR